MTQLHDLEDAIQASYKRPVVIFKHSVSCGISAAAKYNLEEGWDIENVALYYLDLIRYRPISNLISEKLQVIHQSPQMIIIDSGKVKHHTSHHGVTIENLRNVLAQ